MVSQSSRFSRPLATLAARLSVVLAVSGGHDPHSLEEQSD